MHNLLDLASSAPGFIGRASLALLLVAPVSVLISPAKADITNVTASGAGGTLSDLGVGTVDAPNDAVQFGANYTADAPIVFTITLDSTGSNTKFFIDPSGQVHNDTSATLTTFFAQVLSGPPGVTLAGGGQDTGQFGLPDSPSPSELSWSGPGILPGNFTFISFTFNLPTPVVGTETVEIEFGPALSAAPEPSTWAMMLLGFVGLGLMGSHSSRFSVRA